MRHLHLIAILIMLQTCLPPRLPWWCPPKASRQVGARWWLDLLGTLMRSKVLISDTDDHHLLHRLLAIQYCVVGYSFVVVPKLLMKMGFPERGVEMGWQKGQGC